MKNFLKDLGWLIILGLACGIIYQLPIIFFGWMCTWKAWVIALVLVFIGSGLLAIGVACGGGLGVILTFRTPVGIVLACIIILKNLIFSIRACWTAKVEPYTNKEIVIFIFATIFFLAAYIEMGYALVSQYIDRKNNTAAIN